MKQKQFIPYALAALAMMSCSDDKTVGDIINIGPGNNGEHPAEYYAGGELGTTSLQNAYAYRQATPAVEKAGMTQAFQIGESLFERDYQTGTDGAFAGLGPVYIRRGCLYCHPSYGHGKRQTEYKADQMGNGYLLVVYDKKTNNYVYSVAGMPQTAAVKPFKAQIDEKQIKIDWKDYTDEVENLFKRQVIELCLRIHFLCDCLHEVHIEADDVTVFIFIFEGGIGGLHSDTELFLRRRHAAPCFPTTSGGKENSTGCQNESG